MKIFISGQKQFGAEIFEQCLKAGHQVMGVCAPPFAGNGTDMDRLRSDADLRDIPWIPAGTLTADTLPDGVDVLIAAHSHDFIGTRTRYKCRYGAIGYHPSLLPLHRGRDAIRWAIHLRERITGGTVYWLNNVMDGGPIAAQEHVLIRTDDTPEELWRRELYPLGIRLMMAVIAEVARGNLPRIPQDETLATFEPAFDVPRKFRPELPQLPGPDFEFGARVVPTLAQIYGMEAA